jgi:UPF0271 protein
MQSLGDGAIRFARPPGMPAAALLERLRALSGVLDVVVTTGHACVYFRAGSPPREFAGALAAWSREPYPEPVVPRVVTVPVLYDGVDLEDVAGRVGLSADEVAALHAGGTYTVAMVGFLPGFAYLSGVDPRLSIPRRGPRPRVPPRSVAIAAGYTGIYPFASAGGWNVVGTAVGFEPFTAEHGAALAVGDLVRFERVA